MSREGEFIMSDHEEKSWTEDEDDRNTIMRESRGKAMHDAQEGRSRSRSPLRTGSQRVVKSRVSVPDPEERLSSQINKAIDDKLEGFLSRFSDLTNGVSEKSPGFSTKLEELKSAHQELLRQQKASNMQTEGGKFQFLALSKVRSKVEAAEVILQAAKMNPDNFTLSALGAVLEELGEAKKCIDRRMELVSRADSMSNGFKVLSVFEKKMQDSQGASSDPEQDKLWMQTVKQLDKEKKDRERFSKLKRNGADQRPHQEFKRGMIGKTSENGSAEKINENFVLTLCILICNRSVHFSLFIRGILLGWEGNCVFLLEN
jgi:hypothetical protein